MLRKLDEVEKLLVAFDAVLGDPAEVLLVAEARRIEGAPVDQQKVLSEIRSREDLEIENIHRAIVVHVALVNDVGLGGRRWRPVLECVVGVLRGVGCLGVVFRLVI